MSMAHHEHPQHDENLEQPQRRENPEVLHHEQSDVNFRAILGFGAGLFVVAAIVQLLIYVLFGFSSAVFWYGGWPFLKGLFDELKTRKPGMMILISVAIATAYLYASSAKTVGGIRCLSAAKRREPLESCPQQAASRMGP